jgi:hypothetical protein
MQYKNDAIQSFNNFILFSSVIVFFIIAHRGVEETVAASLDATAPKSRPVAATYTLQTSEWRTPINNTSHLSYTVAKLTKKSRFSR